MALKFYNSLSRRRQEFVPRQPDRVGLYTCGPTVYDYAHIGNFRAYMFEDLLKRTLTSAGFRVFHVMNLTDVDDKTIRGSQRAGLSLDAFTRKYKDAFFEDIEALRIAPADVYPAATEHIPDMIDMIRRLMDRGIAYHADDGSVYFAIDRISDYGKLARLDPAGLRTGVRVRNDEYAKESAADFALWKAHSAEDGDVAWASPWGRGRPGWHIECSAMSTRYLGPTFDLHCGGIDNIFPHHENEIAQSEAANGCPFVNYWLHCAHLIVDGEKMSKSLGNFHTLRDVLGLGFNGRETRWVLLGAHYRQPLNFSFEQCADARAALRRLDDFATRLRAACLRPDSGVDAAAGRAEEAEKAFRAGLADDLNISAALAALFDLVRDTNRQLDREQTGGAGAAAVLDVLRRLDAVLGVLDLDTETGIPAAVSELAAAREAARKSGDFERADSIREALQEQGWLIEDTPEGPRIKPAVAAAAAT